MMAAPQFSDLVGQTISEITNNNGEELIFDMKCGDRYTMCHHQDCCESVKIESIVGDLSDLLGEKILRAEEVEQSDPTASKSETWTFYKLATRKGYVDIRWYGSSNGYYSESVSLDYIPYKTLRQREIMQSSTVTKAMKAECSVMGHDGGVIGSQCVVCGATI